MNLGLWNPVTLEVENSRLTYFSIKSNYLLKNNSSKSNDDKLVRQIVLDYKYLIDYSCLLEFSPEGLYVIPEYENPYTWQGGIFVRSGLYAGSFYRFQIELMINDEYPSDESQDKTHKVEFLNPPSHPLVNIATGILTVPKEWQFRIQNNILALLFFIKNIFYLPELITYKLTEESGNMEMSECIRNDPKKAIYKIQRNVNDSIEKSCRLYNSKYSPFKLNFHVKNIDNKEDIEEEKLDYHYKIDDNISSDIMEYIQYCVQSSSNIIEQKEMLNEWILEIVSKKRK